MFRYKCGVWTEKKIECVLPKWILGFADFVFFMKNDKAT